MTNHSAVNERIKRDYFAYLKEAKGRDNATVDGVAKALSRFEESTKARDFKRFHKAQAVAFKATLAQATNARTGERISKATMLSTLRELRSFFFWLAHLPGFKSHIGYQDADYFNLSDKDVTIARARREKRVPTLAQVHHVLSLMPADTVIERRDRALIAFTAMTAARVGALASFRFGHVDLLAGLVEHDARTVRSKFAKTFSTWFMPVGGDELGIFTDWVRELERDHLWGRDDPLFPATQMGLDLNNGFTPVGILRSGWRTTQPINAIFRRAFEAAGLPYFNPHSFRDMIVRHAVSLNLPTEEMKAWSQNLGHAEVMTTLTSYGTVPAHRQGELIRARAQPRPHHETLNDPNVIALIAAIKATR
jgi:integrase